MLGSTLVSREILLERLEASGNLKVRGKKNNKLYLIEILLQGR